MSEQNQKPTDDEKYEYPNEEYLEATPVEEGKGPKNKNFIARFVQQNKRITLIIAIIILVLISFKMMRVHSDKKTIVSDSQQLVSQQLVQPTDPAVISKLDLMQQNEQDSRAAIIQLQGQVESLRRQLDQTSAEQVQLNQTLQTLINEMKSVTQYIQSAQSKQVKVSEKKPVKQRPIIFHLRAIIPGRAWIVSNDGLSQSVSVGDKVPQYGTVRVLDANRGMVLTSSGKVIGYGSNDV